jgi:uncharacterized protein
MSTKSTRGFAAMDPEKQRAIASKGGKAAHAKGTAHRFTTEEASEAGRKGGRAAHARGTAHRFTTEEASEAGRKGGSSRSGTSHQGRGAGTEKSMESERTEGSAMTGTMVPEQSEMRPGMPDNNPGRYDPARPAGEPSARGSEQNASRQSVPTTPSTVAPLSVAP